MSDNATTVVLLAAYGPLVLMGLLWAVALLLRLAGAPGLMHWLKIRTSVPLPEPNPPHGASGEGPG